MNEGAEVGRALGSADPEERRRAVCRIAELAPSVRVPLLLSALGDNDWRVRKEAIGLTSALGPEPDLLTALAKVFEPGDNVGLRNAAVEALGAFGSAAVEALAPVLATLDADGKKLAVEALGRSGEPSALGLLAPLVDDADANVRVAALEAVGAVGVVRADEARALLVPRLEAAAASLETLAALEALVNIGASLPFERVERWLGEPLLEHAALALAAQSGDPRAANPLVQALLRARGPEAVCALSDYVGASEAARRAASSELGQAGERAEHLLLECLERRDGEVEAARAALSVVGALGIAAGASPAVTWLSDPRCYPEADQALFLLGAGAVPALLQGAASLETETAAACLDLLGRLPVDAVTVEARRLLTSALGSPSQDVVRSALGALIRVGDADCMSALVGLLADPQVVGSVEPALIAISQRHPGSALSLVRLDSQGAAAHAAALVISALAPARKLTGLDRAELTAFCMQLLRSTSAEQRRAALLGLGELGEGEALDAVRFALADEEHAVRVEAVRALGRLKAEDHSSVGVPALLEVVAEARDPVLLLASLRALGESSDPRALAVLGPLVRSTDARVAVAAVEALSRHSDPRRLSSLFDGLHHAEPEVVKASMLAIAAEPDPRVIVHLGACLDQSAWDVRRLAADLLGRETSEASAALLRARLGVEQDPMVKDALSRALEATGQRRSRPPRRPQGEI
jgi:HEAT repeat protein